MKRESEVLVLLIFDFFLTIPFLPFYTFFNMSSTLSSCIPESPWCDTLPPTHRESSVGFNTYFRVTLPREWQCGTITEPDTRSVIALRLSEPLLRRIRDTWYVFHKAPCDLLELYREDYLSATPNRLLTPKTTATNQDLQRICRGRHTPGHVYTNDFVHQMRKLVKRLGCDETQVYIDFGKRHSECVLFYAESTEIAIWMAQVLGYAVLHLYPVMLSPRYYHGVIQISPYIRCFSIDDRYFLEAADDVASSVNAIVESVIDPCRAYDKGIRPEMILDRQRMYEWQQELDDEIVESLGNLETKALKDHFDLCFHNLIP